MRCKKKRRGRGDYLVEKFHIQSHIVNESSNVQFILSKDQMNNRILKLLSLYEPPPYICTLKSKFYIHQR